MNYYMVQFEMPEILDEKFVSLIPQNRSIVNQLLAKGRLKMYSLANDRSSIWAVVVAKDEDDVLSLLDQLPLRPYLIPFITELAFHNSTENIMAISLN